MFLFSEFLNDYKEATGMNNRELAMKMGVHENTVQYWAAANRYPTMDVAQDALSKIGYELRVEKVTAPGGSRSKNPEDLSRADYEKRIYERGRNSAFQDIKHQVNAVFNKYI